ncbi:trans-2,3-dihydro-3-hydroxyanthranilate isomerase [Rhizobiales bacterium GAS191]|nr:trans-2,3-dihydro-3-hydroxyanthranilate isomerase [Rhizobiales bacterium GAS191]
MRLYPFVTVDVFTEQRFGGNPLAVVTDARGISDAEMQALASEFNYSETTFVLPPDDPAHTAKVRIFNRTYEMPFAGHPNVGTGYVLAGLGRGDRLVFEEQAGLVEVEVERDRGGALTGAIIAAPQPLSLGTELPVEDVAACIGLTASDVVLRAHPPLVASVGIGFVLVEVEGAALSRAAPGLEAFRRLLGKSPALDGRLAIHLYTQDLGTQDGFDRLRTRMFSPLAGTYEDPATGSANAALAALLLSLGSQERRDFKITQGVEMGRPSALTLSAYRAPDGVRAKVGGSCVPVFKGEARL